MDWIREMGMETTDSANTGRQEAVGRDGRDGTQDTVREGRKGQQQQSRLLLARERGRGNKRGREKKEEWSA